MEFFGYFVFEILSPAAFAACACAGGVACLYHEIFNDNDIFPDEVLDYYREQGGAAHLEYAFAPSPAAFAACACAGGVACLYHEIFNDAVEDHTVIIAVLCQCFAKYPKNSTSIAARWQWQTAGRIPTAASSLSYSRRTCRRKPFPLCRRRATATKANLG